MIIELPGVPVRDISTIDFSSVTTAAVVDIFTPAPGEDMAFKIEFDQELSDDQVAMVELIALTDENGQVIYEKAIQALSVNNNFLAITAPTNAQSLAQIQRLTRECTGLIRLLLNQLSTTSGT